MTTTAAADAGVGAAGRLEDWFLASARRWPDRPAVSLGERELTYAEVEGTARRWAAALVEAAGRQPRRVGLFAYRSEVSYVGVLAALLAGATFVPLNRTFPPARTRSMLERADVDVVLVDRASAAQLDDVVPAGVPVVAPECEVPAPGRPLLGPAAVAAAGSLAPGEVETGGTDGADGAAYLLFTSGSTGQPKGVPVTHGNVSHFLAYNQARYGLGPEDRLSQTFDQTFDLSVFDLFMAWGAGACVCRAQPIELVSPFRYVRDQRITVWFSVPSVAVLLKRKRLLEPGTLPSLRWSLFCGEALPRDVAEDWQRAAPASVVENLYGPTELTIACSVYRWDPARSPAECVNDVVPIGHVYPGLRPVVVDEARRPVGGGQAGELAVAGPQTFPGYWRDPDTTAAKTFVHDGGDGPARYYCTGDRVRVGPDGGLVYLGRVDHQVQVRGYRVELAEVEAALRQHPAVDEAAAVAWPVESGTAQGIVAFVTGQAEPADVVAHARAALPSYMVPATVHVLDRLPLNGSGKTDRPELRRRLDSGELATR